MGNLINTISIIAAIVVVTGILASAFFKGASK